MKRHLAENGTKNTKLLHSSNRFAVARETNQDKDVPTHDLLSLPLTFNRSVFRTA